MMDSESRLTEFRLSPAAPLSAVQAFEASLGDQLPLQYRSFLLRHNGGNGFVGQNYLILLPVDDLYEFNCRLDPTRFLPWLLLIGTNGGGEGYGFDLRQQPPTVVAAEMDDMQEDRVLLIGRSFEEFIQTLLTTDVMRLWASRRPLE